MALQCQQAVARWYPSKVDRATAGTAPGPVGSSQGRGSPQATESHRCRRGAHTACPKRRPPPPAGRDRDTPTAHTLLPASLLTPHRRRRRSLAAGPLPPRSPPWVPEGRRGGGKGQAASRRRALCACAGEGSLRSSGGEAACPSLRQLPRPAGRRAHAQCFSAGRWR